MFSSFLHLAFGSRDLSLAEKEIKLSKFTKWKLLSLTMTAFFSQDLFELSFCELLSFASSYFITFSVKGKSRDPTAN